MKSLNSTDKLWTSLSADETSDYRAACCLNARIHAPADQRTDPEIVIDNQSVSVDFLRKILDRTDQKLRERAERAKMMTPSSGPGESIKDTKY